MISYQNQIDGGTRPRAIEPNRQKPSVAAIIPAFNESRAIEKVLLVLQEVDYLSEIIIVDDGSKDTTFEIVSQAILANPRIKLVRHEANLGKGQAIFSGWRATEASCLLLIDADLINLTPAHIMDLINPVRDGQAHMTFGLFRSGHWETDFSHIVAPWLTGQRCIRRELLYAVPEDAAQGYGFETALTLAAQKHRWVSQSIRMQGVSHLVKENHRGFWSGLKNRATMYGHIYRAWRLS